MRFTETDTWRQEVILKSISIFMFVWLFYPSKMQISQVLLSAIASRRLSIQQSVQNKAAKLVHKISDKNFDD